MLQDEGNDVVPHLEGDERRTRCALILPGIRVLRAREIEKWSNRAVVGPQVEDGGSSSPSHLNAQHLALIIGDGAERRCVGGFDAGYTCIDARLSMELERQLSDERDQHISRRRSNRGIGRSARLRLRIEA